MTATLMTVEFGAIHHYCSLEENSDACLCSSFNRYKKLTEQYVNYDIFVWNNHVLNSNMNTN